MRLGALSDGVATNCGPNPCGMWDMISPSSECSAWQTCAAVQNNAGAPIVETGCVVVGTNAYGDTIVNCPSAPPCLMGSGPLQSGQAYCAGVLDAAQLASVEYFQQQTNASSGSGAPWLLLGVVALALVAIGSRR